MTSLIKLNFEHQESWRKEFVGLGEGQSIEQTSDGGYVINTQSGFIIKTDSLGNTCDHSIFEC